MEDDVPYVPSHLGRLILLLVLVLLLLDLVLSGLGWRLFMS